VSSAARIWFSTFAVIGMVSGLLAVAVLWVIVTRPLVVAQVAAGMP